jgi:hypothetical protein
MSIITRPTKLGGGTDFVAGNDGLAQEFNDDINTIYADHNGGITEANISANMRLPGTNLADSPTGVSTIKINDLAVTNAKLATDAVSAVKVAADAIVAAKIKISTYNITPVTNPVPALGTLAFNTLLTAAVRPLCVYMEATTAILQNGFVQRAKGLLILQILWDTTTSTWWVVITNPMTGNSIDITSTVFKLLYVPAS